MEDPGSRNRPPRHSRAAGGFRAARNVAAIAFIAVAAFATAGLVYNDPRLTELLGLPHDASARRVPGTGLGTGPGAVGHATASSPARQAGVPAAGTAMAVPPPGYEEQDQPLGQARKPAAASSSFKFLATNADGGPVGYSPCRPLHYVVNAAQAPAGAETLVEDAIKTVAAATGIRFVSDGATTELPSQTRAPYQKDAYGEHWAPLLIAWTTPEQAPQLEGPVIGTGGSTHFSFGGGPKTYVTGSLELDAPQITEELQRGDGSAYATAVILHELGHVMGLEHVTDPDQLMYPEIGAPDGLAAGDLNGLYELGRVPCRKDL